jgi:hypothetical protein
VSERQSELEQTTTVAIVATPARTPTLAQDLVASWEPLHGKRAGRSVGHAVEIRTGAEPVKPRAGGVTKFRRAVVRTQTYAGLPRAPERHRVGASIRVSNTHKFRCRLRQPLLALLPLRAVRLVTHLAGAATRRLPSSRAPCRSGTSESFGSRRRAFNSEARRRSVVAPRCRVRATGGGSRGLGLLAAG